MADFLATLRDVDLTNLPDTGIPHWDATARKWKGAPAARIAHTPTLNNFTLGNGSFSAAYQQVGPLTAYFFHLTAGTTSALQGGQFFISGLPTSAVVDVPANIVIETAGGIWIGPYPGAIQGSTIFTGLTSGARTLASGDSILVSVICPTA